MLLSKSYAGRCKRPAGMLKTSGKKLLVESVQAPDLLGEDIVQKDKRLCYVACGLICLWAAMLSGCRSTESPLAKATSRAGRLYDRACALLNDAAYKVGDDYAPLKARKELPEGAVKLVPAGQINPNADAAIKQGIDGLTKAMESAEGQSDLDKLQAKAVADAQKTSDAAHKAAQTLIAKAQKVVEKEQAAVAKLEAKLPVATSAAE